MYSSHRFFGSRSEHRNPDTEAHMLHHQDYQKQASAHSDQNVR